MATSTYITLDKLKYYLEAFQGWVSPTLYNLTRQIMNSGSKYHFITHFLDNGCGDINSLCCSLNDVNYLEGAFSEQDIMSCVALPSLVTSTATNIDKMFYNCSLLHWCDLTYLPSTISYIGDAFVGCTSLTDLRISLSDVNEVNLSDCPLNYDSLYYLLYNAKESLESYLYLSSTTYAIYEENKDVLDNLLTGKGRWAIE